MTTYAEYHTTYGIGQQLGVHVNVLNFDTSSMVARLTIHDTSPNVFQLDTNDPELDLTNNVLTSPTPITPDTSGTNGVKLSELAAGIHKYSMDFLTGDVVEFRFQGTMYFAPSTGPINSQFLNVLGVDVNMDGLDVRVDAQAWDEARVAALEAASPPPPPEIVFGGVDLNQQTPTGLGVAGSIQVKFGDPQTTAHFDMDAAGTFTCLITGFYTVNAVFSVIRGSSAQVAVYFIRLLIDFGGGFVQFGNPISGSNSASDSSEVLALPFPFTFTVGQKFKIEFVRDSGNHDSGGLISRVSADGFGTSPSAAILIVLESLNV